MTIFSILIRLFLRVSKQNIKSTHKNAASVVDSVTADSESDLYGKEVQDWHIGMPSKKRAFFMQLM